MGQVNVFQNFEDTTTKHLQLMYLDYHGFNKEEISKWTGYAISTIKTYVKKFSHLIEQAKQFFHHISQKTKQAIIGKKQLVYLYKFYDDNNKLICSKIGTTTRLPEIRLKEEIRYYKQHNILINRAEICGTIDCGEIPAEGAESALRAYFIKKFPKAFCKNDRFFDIDISVYTFNKIVNNYLLEGGLVTA